MELSLYQEDAEAFVKLEKLRELGYAVVVYNPEEIKETGLPAKKLENFLRAIANGLILGGN